jgi:oxygen-independent coproporphyrinogen-3 oxidase
MTASLYIHIPFCANLCDYCDFYSIAVNEQHNTLMDSFIGAVLGDVKDQFAFFNVDHVPTVYIGGGTPSVLGAARIERLLAGLRTLLEPMKKAPVEFTVEANPESADEEFVRACVKGGVSRISLGVQTFYEPSRRAVHRPGDSHLLNERLTLAKTYFPDAFSVDLITGLPFQTTTAVQEDIERILAFQPSHVSLYSLTLEPETPLGKRVTQEEFFTTEYTEFHGNRITAPRQGALTDKYDTLPRIINPQYTLMPAGFIQPSARRRRSGCRIKTPCNSVTSVVNSSLPRGDEADNLWITGRDMLEKAGLVQYEVSNFARSPQETMPPKTCAHNTRYWRMENWLGAGPAASGTIINDADGSGRRSSYPADINAYLAAPEPRIHSARVEELNKADLIRESLLMGFRCRTGPDPLIFKRRFGCGIEDCIPRTIARWRERGLLETESSGGSLALSREGLLFLNAFLCDAFGEMG